MSRYSVTDDGQYFVLVQSANPENLQAQANDVLAQAVGAGRLLAFTKLAAAGDGHTFLLWIGVAPSGVSTPDGVDPNGLQYYCFLAPNVESMQRQTERALNTATGGIIDDVIDTELAGTTQGHRFMAVILGRPG